MIDTSLTDLDRSLITGQLVSKLNTSISNILRMYWVTSPTYVIHLLSDISYINVLS